MSSSLVAITLIYMPTNHKFIILAFFFLNLKYQACTPNCLLTPTLEHILAISCSKRTLYLSPFPVTILHTRISLSQFTSIIENLQVKTLESTLTALSHAPHLIHQKFLALSSNRPPLWILFPISTANFLIQVTITSFKNYFNNCLTDFCLAFL